MNTHVLIPTHNRQKMLTRLLSSLSVANIPQSIVKIHIIENGSEVARKFVSDVSNNLPVIYHHFADGNKSKALNAVIQTIPPSSFLVFFDDDIRVPQNILERYEQAADKFGPGYFFGGGLIADYEVRPSLNLVPYLPRSARDVDLSDGQPFKKLPGTFEFMGANWGCFIDDLVGAGGFSPDFGPGSKSGARGQETDAQYRMMQAGCTAVAIGNAKVDHWVPAKFISEDWLVERIFLSSIHQGREKASFIKSIGMLVKLQFSWLQRLLGDRSIGPRYRIAKAAGYFKGLVS